jgi:hypothetical protein
MELGGIRQTLLITRMCLSKTMNIAAGVEERWGLKTPIYQNSPSKETVFGSKSFLRSFKEKPFHHAEIVHIFVTAPSEATSRL